MLNIKIILGSTREERRGEEVANWVLESLLKREDTIFEILDLKNHRLPFLHELVTHTNPDNEHPSKAIERWSKKIKEADGFIIVTPEYNRGYPAVLKNALDHAYVEWNRKPVGFVSYSISPIGGARAVEQLRQVSIELQLAPIQPSVHISSIQNSFKDGKPIDSYYNDKLDKLYEHFYWWAKTLKWGRENISEPSL